MTKNTSFNVAYIDDNASHMETSTELLESLKEDILDPQKAAELTIEPILNKTGKVADTLIQRLAMGEEERNIDFLITDMSMPSPVPGMEGGVAMAKAAYDAGIPFIIHTSDNFKTTKAMVDKANIGFALEKHQHAEKGGDTTFEDMLTKIGEEMDKRGHPKTKK